MMASLMGGRAWTTWLIIGTVITVVAAGIAMDKGLKRRKRNVDVVNDLKLESELERIKKYTADEPELHRMKRFKRGVRLHKRNGGGDNGPGTDNDGNGGGQNPGPPRPPVEEPPFLPELEPQLIRMKRDSSEQSLQRVKRAKRNVDEAQEPDLERVKRAKREVHMSDNKVRRQKRTFPEDIESEFMVHRHRRSTKQENEHKAEKKMVDKVKKDLGADKRMKARDMRNDKREKTRDIEKKAVKRLGMLKRKHLKRVPMSVMSMKKRMSLLPSSTIRERHNDMGQVVAKAMKQMKRNEREFSDRHPRPRNNLHRNMRTGHHNSKYGKVKRDMMRLKRLKREINKDIHDGMKRLHQIEPQNMHKRSKRSKHHDKWSHLEKAPAMEKKFAKQN